MKTLRTFGLSLAVLLAAVTQAGIHYQSEQTTTTDGKELSRTLVEGWVDGDNARIEFKELEAKRGNKSPFVEEGAYLLTHDGGQVVYLVNPEEETYMEFDLDAMLAMAGGVIEAMQGSGMMKMEVSDPEVTVLEEKSGGQRHGMDTQFFKIKTVYSIETRMMGFGGRNEVESIQEIYATKAVSDAGLGVWMRNRVRTGSEQLDSILDAEYEKFEKAGFPLDQKQTMQTRSYSKKGKLRDESTTVNESKTTLWENTSIGGDRFKLPEGYERVESPMMMGEAQAEGEEDEKAERPKLRNLFRRKKN